MTATETKPDSIHVLMARVLDDLDPIGKDRVNKDQGFKFRGVEDVQNALHPILAKHGVFCVPKVKERIPETRATRNGGTMNVVHLRVEFTFYGPLGDSVSAETWGEGQDSGDKATNKAMSGAFKYAAFLTFCIATAETEDADRSSEDAAPVDPVAQTRAEIKRRGEALGMSIEQIATDFATSTGLDIRTADLRSLQTYLDYLVNTPEPPAPAEAPDPAEAEAALDAEAKEIRDLACDPATTPVELTNLSLRASKAKVMERVVTGFAGGDFPLREVLDDRIKAKQRHPEETP